MDWNFGCVIFNDDDSLTSGWASIEGDTAFHVQDQTQLSNDVIWWSNASYESFYKAGRRGLISNLRPSNYLEVKPVDILQDWGLDPKNIGAAQFAQLAAALFSRIMRISRGLIKVINPDIHPDEIFIGRRLANDMKDLLPPAEFPDDDAASIAQSYVSFVPFTSTSVPSPAGGKRVVVRRPRIDHAIDILSSPVPNGPFIHKRGSQLPPLKELVNSPLPILAQVSLHKLSAEVSPLYGFGVTTSGAKKSPRSWVSHPELSTLEQFAEMDIRNAFIGSKYSVLSKEMNPLLQSFLTAPEAALSWSLGVVAETLWKAATVANSMPQFRPNNNDVRPQTSWRGIWIKAIDKLITMRYAMELHRAGFSVQMYNAGWISCSVQPSRMEEFTLAAWKSGLVPFLFDVPRPFVVSELARIPWGGDAGSRHWATMVMSKNSKPLWSLDQLPLLSQQEKAALIQSMNKK